MKQAYGYIRVSTVGQAEEGFSLDHQRQAIQDYCKARQIHLLKVFIDEGRSARTTHRPEFLEMLENVRKGLADCVIIYKIDRFARSVKDFSRIWDEFKEKKVSLISVLEGDLSNGSSLIPNIFASVAQWESEVNGQRTKDALMEKFRTGWEPTKSPIGYRSIGGDRERKYCEPDPYAAPIIKRMFQLYSTGNYSIERLKEWLMDKNIVSKYGTIISFSKIHNILTNPFYYGLIRWHGQSKMGKHAPLISKDLFEACNYVLAKNRNFIVRERRYDFLLRGLTFCCCGTRLTADWHTIHSNNKKIAYYHCQKRYAKDCRQPYIEVNDLETQVARIIKEAEFEEAMLDKVIKKAEDYLSNGRKDVDSRKQAIINQKMALEAKRNRLEDLLINGDIDRETFKRKHDELQEKINNLETQLVEEDQESKVDLNLFMKTLAVTRDVYKSYVKADAFVKRLYLKFLYERIVVKDKKIIEAVPTPTFGVFFSANLVRFTKTQLPREDSNL